MDKGNKPQPRHLGHRQRIKERYLKWGITDIDDVDLLELLLTYAIPRRDVYELSRELLQTFGSVENILQTDVPDLCNAGHLTEHVALLLKLVGDIRYNRTAFMRYTREQLSSVIKAAEYCHKALSDLKEESVLEVFLDEKSYVIETALVTQKKTDEAILPVDSIIANAVRYSSKHVLIAHNHPSGNSAPSSADLFSTDTLSKALAFRGIRLMEHIVVAENECTALLHHQKIDFVDGEPFAPWKDNPSDERSFGDHVPVLDV
ncbi:MAG: RadC family protein [Clostridia bacterium]|nr:RadC family protein [Clostridia bacterium]